MWIVEGNRYSCPLSSLEEQRLEQRWSISGARVPEKAALSGERGESKKKAPDSRLRTKKYNQCVLRGHPKKKVDNEVI